METLGYLIMIVSVILLTVKIYTGRNSEKFRQMKRIFLPFLFLFAFTMASAQKQYDFDVRVIGKGTPIVMIPGFASSGEVWNETADHLKNNYELHILTLPGFAGQKAVAEPSLEALKNEIIAYAKDKKLKNPVLMGHSLGGFLSLAIASSAPDLFKKVIVVDGVPFFSALQNPAVTAEQAKMFMNRDALIKQFTAMSEDQLRKTAETTLKGMITDPKRIETAVEWEMKSDRKTMGNAFYEMSTTDLRNEISKITAPVLVLGSNYGTLDESKKILSEQYKNLKNLTLKIADSKHFIMYDQPIWFYSETDQFLK